MYIVNMDSAVVEYLLVSLIAKHVVLVVVHIDDYHFTQWFLKRALH